MAVNAATPGIALDSRSSGNVFGQHIGARRCAGRNDGRVAIGNLVVPHAIADYFRLEKELNDVKP